MEGKKRRKVMTVLGLCLVVFSLFSLYRSVHKEKLPEWKEVIFSCFMAWGLLSSVWCFVYWDSLEGTAILNESKFSF